MTVYSQRADLAVANEIVDFAEGALENRGIDLTSFWRGVSEIVHEFSPRNVELLARRDELQAQIDSYHRQNPGQPEPAAYREFLEEIGYIETEQSITPARATNVDVEIAKLAGPQLVVPLLNARFALNAANARWGSLYDALYGTDAISLDGELAPGREYNNRRGSEVIARGREFLDTIAPLHDASHSAAVSYSVNGGRLVVETSHAELGLADPSAFVGFRGPVHSPTAILLRHNNLHVEILIDRHGSIGASDAAGVQDIVLESALTTIMDLEDSVAAVDAADKAVGYRNWWHLMDGTLTEEVSKGGETFTRRLAADREYSDPSGASITLPGRSVLFVRNVGHLMTSDAVLDREGNPIGEGILDAVMTAVGSLADLQGASHTGNSRTGSMYIVKPKMHGSAEVALAVDLFAAVEKLLALAPMTIKIGIMDEERRTSVNLAACIAAASGRAVFINTGFLDRTGDEIHTSMHAGPFKTKAAVRTEPFMRAYEMRNVAIGLEQGLDGVAQIGKGMWAKPDLMHEMLDQKIDHVRSGASTAWVPSPTAATLHALHYHLVDPFAVREMLLPPTDRSLDELLTIPLAAPGELTPDVVATELDNNVQSILGYVVRWINQGVGCSKVPDIHGIALMEDRATLRISSQLLANWLLHGVISPADVDDSLRRLAPVVDAQNSEDSTYINLEGNEDGAAYVAARRLILEGATQPNGYTEPILHALRHVQKEASKLAVGG